MCFRRNHFFYSTLLYQLHFLRVEPMKQFEILKGYFTNKTIPSAFKAFNEPVYRYKTLITSI